MTGCLLEEEITSHQGPNATELRLRQRQSLQKRNVKGIQSNEENNQTKESKVKKLNDKLRKKKKKKKLLSETMTPSVHRKRESAHERDR